MSSNRQGLAVAVLLITPEGIPLVRDKSKPLPHFWKLPGGKGWADYDPQSVAVGKLSKELGVRVPTRSLVEIHKENRRGGHIFRCFAVTLAHAPPLRAKGRDGEEVRYFALDAVLKMVDLFPNHRPFIVAELEARRAA